jgi:hypothetical protein
MSRHSIWEFGKLEDDAPIVDCEDDRKYAKYEAEIAQKMGASSTASR